MKRLVKVAAGTLARLVLCLIVLGVKSSPTVCKLGLRLALCAWMLCVLPHAILVDLAVDSLRNKLPATVWNTVSLGRVHTAHMWTMCMCWTLLRAPTLETEEVICLVQAPNATAWELAQNLVVTSVWTTRTGLRLAATALSSLSSNSMATLCLRGACRCLLHEDLTLFIHIAGLHVRRGSLGSLTASGTSAPGLPLPHTQHKRGVHVCYTRRRTAGFTSGFRLVLLWGDRGMCGLRTATARPVARLCGLIVSMQFLTTPGGESRTEIVELPLRNPGGTLGPLVQPSITIKLRTQFFGACSLKLCTRVV